MERSSTSTPGSIKTSHGGAPPQRADKAASRSPASDPSADLPTRLESFSRSASDPFDLPEVASLTTGSSDVELSGSARDELVELDASALTDSLDDPNRSGRTDDEPSHADTDTDASDDTLDELYFVTSSSSSDELPHPPSRHALVYRPEDFGDGDAALRSWLAQGLLNERNEVVPLHDVDWPDSVESMGRFDIEQLALAMRRRNLLRCTHRLAGTDDATAFRRRAMELEQSQCEVDRLRARVEHWLSDGEPMVTIDNVEPLPHPGPEAPPTHAVDPASIATSDRCPAPWDVRRACGYVVLVALLVSAVTWISVSLAGEEAIGDAMLWGWLAAVGLSLLALLLVIANRDYFERRPSAPRPALP